MVKFLKWLFIGLMFMSAMGAVIDGNMAAAVLQVAIVIAVMMLLRSRRQRHLRREATYYENIERYPRARRR